MINAILKQKKKLSLCAYSTTNTNVLENAVIYLLIFRSIDLAKKKIGIKNKQIFYQKMKVSVQ